jgi:hypothetical protein
MTPSVRKCVSWGFSMKWEGWTETVLKVVIVRVEGWSGAGLRLAERR